MASHKFLVISWDNDQEQVFWDRVMARDSYHAQEIIDKKRPYAKAVDALVAFDMTAMAHRLMAKTPREIRDEMKLIP